MTEIVLLSSVRTPIGAFQGALSAVPAPALGATVIRAAVARAGLAPAEVTDCLMGSVLQAGQGQAPARQAALAAGLPPSVNCVTVNKVCGSGLQTVITAAQALQVGAAGFVVAGGMENMSLAPYLLPQARAGYRMGDRQVVDSMVHDGLWNPYDHRHMGACAEECAKKYSFTRGQQDAYAAESYRRANTAQQAGRFDEEIEPVANPGARGETRFERDECPGKVRYEKMPALKPVFAADGTITAANASGLSDGAAALTLTTAERARARGLKPVARITGFGRHAQEPVWFTTSPVQAARRALDQAGWRADDVDLWEINEAFAVVPLAFMREVGVPHEKLNVHGGAIALGHPIGASGARILVTLIAALRARGLRRGVAAICIGGGEALAAAVELS